MGDDKKDIKDELINSQNKDDHTLIHQAMIVISQRDEREEKAYQLIIQLLESTKGLIKPEIRDQQQQTIVDLARTYDTIDDSNIIQGEEVIDEVEMSGEEVITTVISGSLLPLLKDIADIDDPNPKPSAPPEYRIPLAPPEYPKPSAPPPD